MTTRTEQERNHGIKFILPNGNYILMWEETNYTGVISVRNAKGTALWQKTNCTINDFPFAIEIANRGIQTDVFES